MLNISLDLYRVFLTVARLGSISAAARALSISQPAVSQSVRQLETALTQSLFVRTAKGVELTEQGRALFGYVDQACALLDAGQAHLDDLRALRCGEVRIGASDSLCKHFLLPYLEAFHAQYGAVALHVTNRTSDESIALLKKGQVDLAVINLPMDLTGIRIRARYAVHDVFVVGGKFAHLAGQRHTLAQLCTYPLVMLETASNSRRAVDAFAQSRGVTLSPAIELGSLDLVADFARVGLGVGLTVREFIQKDLNNHTLGTLSLAPALPQRHVAVATLEGVPLSSAAQAFMALMEQDEPR